MPIRSIYKSPEGEARCMAVYEAALAQWPVPYEQLDVVTRFGGTHIIASGPRDAPPLVLLHGQWASATMWSSSIASLSRIYRAYAVDQVDDVVKSVPSRPEDEHIVAAVMNLRSRIPFRPVFADEEFENLKMPALLVIGDKEGIYEAKSAVERSRQLIPHIEAEIIPHAGHMLHRDQPEIVNSRVLKFLICQYPIPREL